MMKKNKLKYCLQLWNLTPDGKTITTHSSQLIPVVTEEGKKAVLKITNDESEKIGNSLMVWWEGNGAANVLAHEGEAIVLKRAVALNALSEMSSHNNDKEACRIICQTANYLHNFSKRIFSNKLLLNQSLLQLVSLNDWFSELKQTAKTQGDVLNICCEISEELLNTQDDIVVLHGDLHHNNILYFGKTLGYLAIDPKGLIGERTFDYANIFMNPDLGDPNLHIAIKPEIFEQRLKIIVESASLEKERLLMWIVAWGGLSAAWSLKEGQSTSTAIGVVKLALAHLGNSI